MDLCSGAKEQQGYYDVDCEETDDYDLPCNTRAASVAFGPLSASAIAVTQNHHPPHEPCKCSNYTKTIRRNGRETLLGNCNSRYRGYLWCYVDNPTNCRDFTYAKKSGKFRSFSASYLECKVPTNGFWLFLQNSDYFLTTFRGNFPLFSDQSWQKFLLWVTKYCQRRINTHRSLWILIINWNHLLFGTTSLII